MGKYDYMSLVVRNPVFRVSDLVIPPVYEVYRGYIVFAFSVTMFVCVCVCV